MYAQIKTKRKNPSFIEKKWSILKERERERDKEEEICTEIGCTPSGKAK